MDELKALGDDNRFRIIELLMEKEYCVCALARQLGISEPAVSQHLKVLKTCGLVAGKKEGYFVHYQVNEEKIREIIERLSALLEMKNNQNAGQSLCSQEREA